MMILMLFNVYIIIIIVNIFILGSHEKNGAPGNYDSITHANDTTGYAH